MRVIKEGWVLQHVNSGLFVNSQNTTIPKLYYSEFSAAKSNELLAKRGNDGILMHTPVKAYLVIEEDDEH